MTSNKGIEGEGVHYVPNFRLEAERLESDRIERTKREAIENAEIIRLANCAIYGQR